MPIQIFTIVQYTLYKFTLNSQRLSIEIKETYWFHTIHEDKTFFQVGTYVNCTNYLNRTKYKINKFCYFELSLKLFNKTE